LSEELELALSKELLRAYCQINGTLFRSALKRPVLKLANSKTFLGRWDSEVRTLEINRSFALNHAWTSVVEVLKHEMAHQYVDEVLGDSGAGHGPSFRSVCERFCIDPRASGIPTSQTDGAAQNQEEERVLTRVARLLALADSPNENEAHAAMSAAQRLMLRHNIDRAGASSSPVTGGDRRYGFRQVGRISGRMQECERVLASLLVSHFFVDAIWVPAYEPTTGRSGTVLEICGTPANLEMAVYVHTFLTHTAESLWQTHKKTTGTTSNRERQTFLAGVIIGFQERLSREKEVHEGEGLVWVGDAGLKDYMKARHPYVRHFRRAGRARTSTREQGKNAGRDIILRKPIDAPSRERGLMLTRGSR